jgi:VWFA-related protein
MRSTAIWLVLLLTPAYAQQDSGVILRADTRVVQVDVTVRNSGGKPVEDLKQSDFTILDNGKLRPFTIFSVNRAGPDAVQSASQPLPARPALPSNTFTNVGEPPPPAGGHSTIILLDGVNGWFESFAFGSKGIQGLMNKLPADERIAIYVVTKNEGLLQIADFTTDRDRIRKAMSTFSARGMSPSPLFGPGDGRGMVEDPPPQDSSQKRLSLMKAPARETEYFMRRGAEDIRLSFSALADRLRTQPGRKSVFWVTEGFPPRVIRNDQIAWQKTFTALNDANIAVNTVDTDGLGGPPRLWGAGAILTMQQVAEETGGQAFFHRNDLDTAMAEGVENSRSSYTLGFYLTELDGNYHQLKVLVDRPGLELEYRQGYNAQTDSMHDLMARKTELDSVLVSPLDLTGLGIVAKIDTKGGSLTVHLRFEPKSLTVTETAGVWNGKVEELFFEQNAAGNTVARVSQTSRFQVSAAGKANYDRLGPTLTHVFKLAPNAAKLVIVIRDSASGRTGSLTLPLAARAANQK